MLDAAYVDMAVARQLPPSATALHKGAATGVMRTTAASQRWRAVAAPAPANAVVDATGVVAAAAERPAAVATEQQRPPQQPPRDPRWRDP